MWRAILGHAARPIVTTDSSAAAKPLGVVPKHELLRVRL